jgi:hypothetical protein
MKSIVSLLFLLVAALLTVPGPSVRPSSPALQANDTVRYTYPAPFSVFARLFRV